MAAASPSFLLLLAVHYLSAVLASGVPKRADAFDVLDWVDPLIGSRSGGNVFAGATLPYGMAKGKSLWRAPRFCAKVPPSHANAHYYKPMLQVKKRHPSNMPPQAWMRDI